MQAPRYSPRHSTWHPRTVHSALILAILVFLLDAPLSALRVHAAGGANMWSSAAALRGPRSYQTATTLPDARILVAGGCTVFLCGPGATLASAEIYNPATGTWAPTGAMQTARVSHTATLLPNGKVLVAGGCSGDMYCSGPIFASAELYNPATGTFTSTRSMAAPRGGATATLLADGRVLVASGQTPAGGLLTSAELYNPATETWTPTGSLHVARRFGTATLLPDGTVLVVGGDNFGAPVTDAEIYHPNSGTWTQVTSPHAAHGQGATATLFASGQVLLAGGDNSSGNGAVSTDLYTPATGTWTPTGALNVGRAHHTATLLADGQVLVAGSDFGVSSAELYDPATGTWSLTGAMLAARSSHTASLLPDGQVLVAGGCCAANNALSSAELFTPGAGPLLTLSATQVQIGPEPLGTTSAAAPITLTNTGTLPLHMSSITLGGSNPGAFAISPSCSTATIAPGASCTVAVTYTPRDFGFIFIHAAVLTLVDDAPNSPQTVGLGGTVVQPHTWTPTASMHTARTGATATLLLDGRVLVAGGCGTSGCAPPEGALAGAEIYSPATGAWMPTGNLNTARGNHTATLLPGGRVLVAGGYDASGHVLARAEIYDPGTGTWASTGALNIARSGQTATLLPSGQVLVAGGSDAAGHALASAELYNPATGTWTATGHMNVGRDGHTATLLPNGQVLVAGGGTSSAELYNPATGTWTLTGAMSTARVNHTATLLSSGQVLVAGGCCDNTGSPLGTVELYNPMTGTWVPTGSMTFGRQYHTATLLPGGQVLAAGGLAICFEGICEVNDTAEVYSPLTGRWSITGLMSTAREFHTATLLRDGTVLVTGGDGGGFGSYGTNSAEIDVPPATGLLHSSGEAGSNNAVRGLGFAPHETVVAYWGVPGGLRLGSTTASALGGFGGTSALSFTVPMSATGPYAVYSVGQTSGNVAVSLFALTAR